MLQTQAKERIAACVKLEMTTSCQALSREQRMAGSRDQAARVALLELLGLQPFQLYNFADSSQDSETQSHGGTERNMPDTRTNAIPPVTAERHGGEPRDSPITRHSQQAASIRDKIHEFFRIQTTMPFFSRTLTNEENMKEAAQFAEQWREHRKAKATAKVSRKRKSEEDATARKHKSVKTSISSAVVRHADPVAAFPERQPSTIHALTADQGHTAMEVPHDSPEQERRYRQALIAVARALDLYTQDDTVAREVRTSTSNVDSRTCPRCRKVFTRPSWVPEHKATYFAQDTNDGLLYPCPGCSDHFDDSRALTKHMTTCSSAPKDDSPVGTRARCKQVFTRTDTCTKHKRDCVAEVPDVHRKML